MSADDMNANDMNASEKNPQAEGEAFARRAKVCFDGSVERLDAEALSRLCRARQAALTARRRPSRLVWRGLLPATGLAAAIALVVLLVHAPEPATLPADGDAELLFGEENLEMLEDLEFYYWMDEVDGGPAGDRG